MSSILGQQKKPCCNNSWPPVSGINNNKYRITLYFCFFKAQLGLNICREKPTYSAEFIARFYRMLSKSTHLRSFSIEVIKSLLPKLPLDGSIKSLSIKQSNHSQDLQQLWLPCCQNLANVKVTRKCYINTVFGCKYMCKSEGQYTDKILTLEANPPSWIAFAEIFLIFWVEV